MFTVSHKDILTDRKDLAANIHYLTLGIESQIGSSDRDYLIALYGSHARHDADALSDVDILVAGLSTGIDCATVADSRVSISAYSWRELEGMRDYGSLFVHHLAFESRILRASGEGGRLYSELLTNVPPYSRAARDVRSFKLALSDARSAIEMDPCLLAFELSCVLTTMRHAAIVGCYAYGQPLFGRVRAVETFCDLQGIDDPLIADFGPVYRSPMLTSSRQMDSRFPDMAYFVRWLGLAERLVEGVANALER